MNVFKIHCMELVQVTNKWRFPIFLEKGICLLIIVAEGKGELNDDQANDVIEEGDLFVFHSGISESSIIVTKEPVFIYYIEFSCAKVCRREGEWCIENDMIPLKGKVNTRQVSIIYHYIKELYDIWCEDKVDTFKIQSCFSKIWNLLLTRSSEDEHRLNSEQVITNITEHIDEHYDKTFQVERMAQFSRMNVTSFYQQFKEYTALSPIQYITKKRIDNARGLLMTGNLSMLEIAKAVGYQDAYYFSRVFKKTVGIPPRKYQKSLQRKIVVLIPSFVGDLIALGIPRERIVLMLDEKQQQKHGLGMYASSFQLEQLRQEEPDIIIGTDRDILNYDNLAEIAPTWLIPYKQKTWREQLIQLAKIIHAKEVALNWLRFYDLKAVAASEKILKKIRSETILVARIFNKGVRIFGKKRRKVGDLLYRDLKLRAPLSTKDFHFKDVVHLEELNQYNADYILLLDDQNDHNTEIMSLKGNVFRAQVRPWLHYSALGQAQALDEAVKFFANRKFL